MTERQFVFLGESEIIRPLQLRTALAELVFSRARYVTLIVLLFSLEWDTDIDMTEGIG